MNLYCFICCLFIDIWNPAVYELLSDEISCTLVSSRAPTEVLSIFSNYLLLFQARAYIFSEITLQLLAYYRLSPTNPIIWIVYDRE